MRLWAPVFLALAASACSNTPVRIESRALADQISLSPEHFIIAAVDNDPNVFVAPPRGAPPRLGQTPALGAGPAARPAQRAPGEEYGGGGRGAGAVGAPHTPVGARAVARR